MHGRLTRAYHSLIKTFDRVSHAAPNPMNPGIIQTTNNLRSTFERTNHAIPLWTYYRRDTTNISVGWLQFLIIWTHHKHCEGLENAIGLTFVPLQ
jgi:hypothetical protein